MRPSRVYPIVVAVLIAHATSAKAGMVTISRLDTDDIVIPTFDTSLGTLTNVQLQVTLRAGTTSVGGGHDHGSYQILSYNTYSSPYNFGVTTRSSTGVSGHAHSVVTPTYSGGGLSIGNFAFNTDAAGGHLHGVEIRYAGYAQVGINSYRAYALIDTLPYSGHTASYASTSTALGFTGPDLIPFLGGSDIVIAAGAITTSASGTHSHTLPSFSVGPWGFNSSSIPTSGTHNLALDPRFDTVATFTFEEPSAVPEPASIALLGMGGVSLFGYGWRRRKSLTNESC